MGRVKRDRSRRGSSVPGLRVPVSERAIMQRLNRALAKQGEFLRKARGISREHVGDFYTANGRRGHEYVTRREVDIKKLARDLGVLQPWEEIVGEGEA